METTQLKARILTEALPWIKQAAGSVVVIKYGGSAMVDPVLRASVASDLVLMKLVGLNPVIVHGGGKEVSGFMERLGLDVRFVDGLRVTTDEAMDVVKMVLVGKVNKELVSDINAHGRLAVGVSGDDANLVVAKRKSPELGRVGDIVSIDTSIVESLIGDGFIPVVASVAAGDDGGSYNINADLVAGELAAALHAKKVIFLTDVDGLYRDFSDKDSLISVLTAPEAQGLLESGDLESGMIPKITACATALAAGVQRAHILNGTLLHALLLEIFTDEGIGTMIVPSGEE